MTVLENILSQEIIQKLGWTLVHFIWQAAVAALLLATLLKLLRKSTPSLRYIIACLALGLIVLLPVITIRLVPVSAPHPAIFIEPVSVPIVSPTGEMFPAETIVFEGPVQPESVTLVSAESWKQRAIEVLEPGLPYIVTGWLAGVFGLSIWHLGGWTQLQRLKRRMVKQVDGTLHSKLKVLSQKLRVKQTVQLMESALVQIPTVVGWLRPVILLPASALTGLNSEQLEAILAHELAHIRRHDYLVNMLQTVVEILGFYHPAVWWVSHKIRAERENCCDDLAVSISGDRVCYAKALTSMEEIRTGHGQLAVAAGGGNLFKRIYRLLGKDSAEKTSLSWIPAATAILLILALVIPTALALTNKSNPLKAEPNTDTQVTVKEFGSNNNSETGQTRIVHFPNNRTLGVLKLRDISSDDDSERGLLSLPGWVLLGQAQSDVSVPAGKELRLEVSEDVTDFSFLADLKLDDLQALKLSQTGISDEDLVHLKSLSGLLGLDLGSTAIKGPGLVHLAPLTSLRKLSLFNTQVSDAGLEHLSTLRSLKYLNLYITQVRGPGLKHLKNLTSLISLDLAATPITNESLAHLAEMTWLKELELQDTNIGDKGLAYLKPLRSLEELILGNADLKQGYSPITDEGLVYLKELGSIKNLYLLRTRVTDAGLAHLRNLKKLEALLLTETQITGEGLAFLKDLPKLKYLDLNKTAVTDEGLVYLKDLKSLRTLYIPAENLSQTDLEDLEKALPNCAINGRKPIATIRPPKPKSAPAEKEQQTDSQVEAKRVFSADKLKWLGLAVAMYANDHDKQLPDALKPLKPYIANEQDYLWLWDNVKYVLKETKYFPNRPHIPVAYDKTQKEQQSGTNVLFLDGHVEFLTTQRLSELDMKRAKFLIETWILLVNKDFIQNINHNADSPDEAKELIKLKPKLLAAVDGSNKLSFIPLDHNVNLLLKAVKAHKDSKVLVAPQVICLEDKTAEIKVMSNETFSLTGYTKPNTLSEKHKQWFDKVQEGIALSLRPILTPNKNIYMQLESEITQFLDSEERKFNGKAPYKPPKVQRHAQSLSYRVQNGETFLFGGHKIPDLQNGQTEQKDLLVLIKAQTIGSSEQDKPAQAEHPAPIEQTSSTTKVITPPTIAKSRTERPEDYEQEKTKPKIQFEDSAKKLSNLGHALLIYANDHEDKYPDSLHRFTEYLKFLEDSNWAMTNVEYLARGKTIAVRPDIVIAYDKTLLAEGKGTNVLFNDSHVEFVKPEKLKELGIISATAILIETRLLSVSEDFLKDIGLDANSVDSSGAWSEHLVADSAAEPNSETYSLILDKLHISFLLKAVQAHQGSKMLAAPQVLTREGTTASIGILTEEYYVLGYNEPNGPSDKPVAKLDKVELGTRIWLKPELTPDNQNVHLDFKMEIRQLLGYEEGKYKGKYIYMKPRLEVVSTKMPCLIPDGKTLLIVGLKIIEQVESRSGAPLLSKLPLIGKAFRSRNLIKDHKMLLILVKPIINPQQKASKILPGEADSEEHIKSLARQLDKKLNHPAEPK